MRFLNLILILLMWTEAVFAVSTTDNNQVVGKTLKVANEYLTSLSKVDGSFESGTTGWVASNGTITRTASTEYQGNYKGLWSATGAGTLDLQWTATASNTYEASAIVSVSGADSDHYICAVVNGVETGCTLFDGPDYTPNKQIKVSVVADSVKAASFYLRIKHTGSDTFSMSIDDGKIQPWTAQTVQTMEQDNTRYYGISALTTSGSYTFNCVKFPIKAIDTYSSYDASTGIHTIKKTGKYTLNVTVSPPTSYTGSTSTDIVLRAYQNGALIASSTPLASISPSSVPQLSIKGAIIDATAGDQIRIGILHGSASDTFTWSASSIIDSGNEFSLSANILRNNVVQAWQAPDTIGEIKYLPQNIAPNGFIPANGVTIGNSGATYSGAQYLELYKVLWNIATPFPSDPYSISSAKGASASADWAANKTITIDESGFFTRAYQYGVTAEVGERQWDEIHDHTHGPASPATAYSMPTAGTGGSNIQTGVGTNLLYASETGGVTYGAGAETRPMNVAKYAFIRYAVSTPTLLALPTSKENNFSARISSAGGITSVNSDFITSVTKNSTGNYTVNYTKLGLSVIPKINVSGSASEISVTSITSTSCNVLSASSSGAAADSAFEFFLSKQGADYTTPGVFVGNINPDGFNKTSGTTGLVESFSFAFGTGAADIACSASPCSYISQIGNTLTSMTRVVAGVYTLNFNKTFSKIICNFNGNNAAGGGMLPELPMICANCSSMSFQTINTSKVEQDSSGTISCQGY